MRLTLSERCSKASDMKNRENLLRAAEVLEKTEIEQVFMCLVDKRNPDELCACAEGVLGLELLKLPVMPNKRGDLGFVMMPPLGAPYVVAGYISGTLEDYFGVRLPLLSWNDNERLSFTEIAERLRIIANSERAYLGPWHEWIAEEAYAGGE